METDAMAESTSTLQAKLKALTHGKVDIMADAETFKSTTQILREMADAWEYMTDIERASALELMGGKRQANILSSLISNFDIVEDVIQTSLNSENSAIEENAKYLDSMQGRIDQLTNSMQSMWVNAMDSEFLKFLISVADGFVQIVDKVGLFNVAIAAFMGKTAFSGKKFGIANLFSSITSGAEGASAGITILGKTLQAGSLSFNLFNAAATMGVSLLAGALISGLIKYADEVIKTADEIKQEAKDITQAYTDAIEEVNSNFKTLGITSDADSATALEKEFATLAAGVDRYGNNISLTSDEYARYKEICEQIVGINPRIASGYDSATEAIGNNATILSQLIDLQKEQARIAAEEYVNDENLETLSKDAVNDYKDARKEYGSDIVAQRNELFGMLNQGSTKETMEYILRTLGYTEADITNTIAKYFMAEVGDYDSSSFMKDFIDEISAESGNFDGYTKDLDDFFTNYENTIKSGEQSIQEAQDGLIDTLLIVPTSDKDYDKLSSEGKNFLSDWIQNSEIFKIDESTTEEDVQKMRDTILNMMDILVSDAKTVNYDGKMLTAQDLLSKIYNFDASSVNYDEYKKQIDAMLQAFWNSLSEDQKDEYGYTDFESFKISLGFDFETEDQKIEDAKNQVARFLDISITEVQKHLDGMSAAEVKAFYSIDWNEVGDDGVDTWQDVMSKIRASLYDSNVITVKVYSALEDEVSSYNDILSQTSEIVADNTEVTQGYKDSLKDLGISEEDLSACFDENNGLIVKNAKALNQLVKSANKNVAANVKLAKSNARLEYYDLVKQLNNTMSSTKVLDATTRDSIQSTLAQIDAVEQALFKYQLLEDTLLGVNNAFDEFAKAQEIDSLNTYGDSYVEMAQTMYDALYKTGQVGTEAFWSSVEALVPTEVYQGLTEDADRMKAIYDYYNKNILPSLQLEDDQLSLDYEAVEEFVEKGLSKGVFEGDVEGFDLVEGMNLEKAAELMGMTEAQAYALFAELDKYNTAGNEHSFLSQLDDSLEGRITNITNDVEDLNKQKLALLEDGGYAKNKEAIDEINDKLTQSEAELNKLGKEAYNTWQEYTKNDAVLAALGEVEDKQRKLTKEEANKLGLEWDEAKGQTVQQAYDTLLEKQLELEEPTVLTAQLAIDNIDGQIAALKQKLADSEKDPTVLGVKADADLATIESTKQEIRSQIQALEEDKVTIATDFGIELSEEDKAGLQEELNAIEQFTINDKTFTVIANGTSETMLALKGIQDYQIGNKSYTVTTVYQTVGSGNNETSRVPYSGGRYTKAAGADGTAHAQGSWGAPKTETALVGELGPELLVRNGRWTTIGDNGAEFTQIKKGDIIFNHKQTEDLLSKGYVTGRGKAYASGTAYSGLWGPTSPDTSQSNKPGNDFSTTGDELYNASKSLSEAADAISGSSKDAADEFREVFDWIEVRLEEINEDLNLKSAKLENAVGSTKQNAIVDDMIELNQKLYDNLIAGSNKYYAFAAELLKKVPEEYREAAQDGSIAIEAFVDEVDEETLEAIQNYREWVQKGADATQQAEETLTEISALAKQAIDNIAADFDNKTSINDNKIEQLEAYNALLETDKGSESANIYQKIIDINNANIKQLQKQRDQMQKELNEQVEAGNIKKYSQDWYDAVNDIAAVDTEIIELKTDTENYQDAINQLHWDNFDNLIERLDAVSNEADNLIDILDNKDMVDESGNWTDEGITSLGLYAQKMEVAEKQARQYQEEINYLNRNWKSLGYTEDEYLDKLDELKDGQYEAIQAYHDSKDAIVDLNKERINAIKEGIEKEIEAYEELISKKKEELDAEKDLYDFQKSVMEQEKNIADLERQLAALAGDNSASARAKRAQLEAELLEAQAELQESYYERSISGQQDALDKELESFQEEKDAEMENWNAYLENTEQVVAESLSTIQENTGIVYQTLQTMGQEYGLSITESITSPWKDGEIAIQSYSEKFGLAVSSMQDELDKLEDKYSYIEERIESIGDKYVEQVNNNAETYQETEYQEPKKEDNQGSEDSGDKTPSTSGLVSSLSGYIQYGNRGDNVKKLQRALNELGYGNSGTSSVDGIFGSGTKLAVQSFQKAMGISADGIVGPDTKKKFKAKGYFGGTKGVDEDQWALIDELGEELILRAHNGRLTYMEKGTGVVPADLTSNLMGWGKLDPSIMLDQNRPSVGVHPEIHNTEIQIDNSIAELIHIDHCSTETLPDVEKIVNKALEQHTQRLNQSLRKYTR